MLEFRYLSGGKRVRNDVRSIIRVVSNARCLEKKYLHDSLLIQVRLEDAAVLHNELTQILNRGLCPPVDLWDSDIE